MAWHKAYTCQNIAHVEEDSAELKNSAFAGIVQRRGVKRLRTEVMVDFDPVRHLLNRLEARYANLAVFFYDSIGGRSIGVKWRKQNCVAQHIDLSAAQALNAGLRRGKAHDFNLIASVVLADMACMAAGLVAGIQTP